MDRVEYGAGNARLSHPLVGVLGNTTVTNFADLRNGEGVSEYRT